LGCPQGRFAALSTVVDQIIKDSSAYPWPRSSIISSALSSVLRKSNTILVEHCFVIPSDQNTLCNSISLKPIITTPSNQINIDTGTRTTRDSINNAPNSC
jgi:hypothetical protein